MIRYLLAISFLLLFSNQAYAVVPDMRISDNDSDVIAITSGGALTITTTNTPGTPSRSVATDIRISDDQSDVLVVNTNGSLNASLT